MTTFRLAHLSDLHVLELAGAVPFRLLNKRLTGYANLRLKRKHVHKTAVVAAILRHLKTSNVDHVAITGDVSNLALEVEFEAVRTLLKDELGLLPEQVSLVPGNHDVYTRGAARSRRFYQYFEPYLRSDLPLYATAHVAGPFPFVKFRGPLAIIGLASARPQPPFVAAGEIGEAQLRALAEVLAHPKVLAKTPVFLVHHPLHNPASRLKSALEGLHDADALAALLSPLARGLVLHGHLHRRIQRRLITTAGHLDVIGATSASLIHENPGRMGGFNWYEFDDAGAITSITSQRLDPASGNLLATSFEQALAS